MRKIDFKFIEFCKKQKGSIDGGLRKKSKIKNPLFSIITVNLNDDLEKMYAFLKNTGYVWFFKDICFVSERPIKIVKEGFRLHCDGGAAVEFADGYQFHCLNGINVPKWVAETNPEKLDLKKTVSNMMLQ